MRRVTPYVVGWAATLLLGVSHAVADPTTEQTLVAMSLLTGEDQKPPVQKPKAPPPGSLGQAPAQPTAPAAPAKPGMPAPTAGTPAPTPAAPAAAPGPKEAPKPAASPAITMTAAPGAAVPPADSVEGYSYDPKSRRDPFQSLTKVIKSASLQSQMPPLQRVQISDMKLLGIMWGGYGYHGLIQTPDGKGYTVKEGMLLGTNNGVIRTITDKAIIVSEPTIDIAGRKSTKEVELLLRPREVTE